MAHSGPRTQSALLQAAPKPQPDTTTPASTAAVQALVDALTAERDPNLRLALLVEQSRIESEEALIALIPYLGNDTQYDVRERIRLRLADKATPMLLTQRLGELTGRKDDTGFVKDVARTVCAIRNPTLVPHIGQCIITAKTPLIVEMSAEALASIGTPEAARVLVGAYGNHSDASKAPILRAITHLTNTEAITAMERAIPKGTGNELNDAVAKVRAYVRSELLP